MKVKKDELRDLLMSSPKQQNSQLVVSGQDTVSLLWIIWTSGLGIPPGTLTAKTSFSDWAEDLIFPRFAAVSYEKLDRGLVQNI
ncbi:hypothetical protein WAI453_004624 [Rhynchosporium graminicola]